jgi:hypothetical protein
MAFTESGSAQFFIGESSIVGGGGGYDIYAASGQGISFFTNALRRVDIDTSGNLLVGTTSALASTKFSLVSSGNGFAVQVGNGSVGSYMTNTSSTANWQPFSFNNNGTSFSQIGSITCTASATAYNTSSDDGMVAQELQAVAPEAVSAPEDPEEMMGVDYSKLVPMLVKEIQSLRARVAQLETEEAA